MTVIKGFSLVILSGILFGLVGALMGADWPKEQGLMQRWL